MRTFGLVGKKLEHSFSPAFFREKFMRDGIHDATYRLYELENINQITSVFEQKPDGLNVTIPYKISIIEYLDDTDEAASAIGAVNCIALREGKYIGFNTDWLGFYHSLINLIGKERPSALILGNGGASRAVIYALRKLKIQYKTVARSRGDISFQNITCRDISDNKLIINTTPLGTYPDTGEKPDIPYTCIGDEHFLFDLIYNPEKTLFLTLGKSRGAAIKNGREMLEIQAEESWKIWNNKD